MTKNEMIETLIKDALQKSDKIDSYSRTFGRDADITKHALTEWAVSYRMLCKFGLKKRYTEEGVKEIQIETLINA